MGIYAIMGNDIQDIATYAASPVPMEIIMYTTNETAAGRVPGKVPLG